MNQVTLLGRLANDPEMRYTAKGVAVTRFTIAVNRDRDKEKADFIFCLCFGKTAESVASYCKKGRQLLVSGRIEINAKKDEKTEKVQYFTNVICGRIEFLAKPQE